MKERFTVIVGLFFMEPLLGRSLYLTVRVFNKIPYRERIETILVFVKYMINQTL